MERTAPGSEVTARLARFLEAFPGRGLAVAYSGGRDSTVLLHALAGLAGSRIRALHVHHGLHPRADAWQEHCASCCRAWGIPFLALPVQVRPTGAGLEAAAREARYRALAGVLAPGECLLTAHHGDDQLETVLLHLVRGSGVAGLAGIPASSPLGAGLLCRPLLDVPGAAVAGYAADRGLAWVEDPTNLDRHLDRNYLRHEVLPALRARWPALAAAAGRSARFSAEAADLLTDLAREDEARLRDPAGHGHRLALEPFRQLPAPRQRNLLRYVVRSRGWPVPPERRLVAGLAQLLGAPAHRLPVLGWPGGEVRRYRDGIYFLDGGAPGGSPAPAVAWNGREALDLGAGRGLLRLERVTGAGLRAEGWEAGFTVGFPAGPARLKPVGDAHHRSLKYLFQEAGLVPWMRPHVPLIWSGDRLVAVGHLWIAGDAAAGPGEPGLRIRWEGHPPLF